MYQPTFDTMRPAPTRVTRTATVTEQPGAVAHYLDLLRLGSRRLALLALLGAALSGGLAVVKLITDPTYVATATVTVQPSNAELEFTRDYVRGASYDSANVVTQSHMEYLRSRETAVRVYEELAGGSSEPPPPPSLLSQAKRKVKQTLRWINSGVWPQSTGIEGEIDEIRDSMSLSMVESTFIMQIGVRWDDPQEAAIIANMLAEVYRDRNREQIAQSTQSLQDFLEGERAAAVEEAADLRSARSELMRENGITDFQTERTTLLQRLSQAESDLVSARSELSASNALLASFGEAQTNDRRNGLSVTTEEELALAQVRSVELEQLIAERTRTVADLRQEIARFAAFEAPLEEADAEIARVRDRINDIETRIINVRTELSDQMETLRLIDPATPPGFPAEPKVINSTLSGFVGGIILGLMLIFMKDLGATRAKTRADLAAAGDVRVLRPLNRADVRRGKGSVIDWPPLDTPLDIMVLDVKSDARSAKLADLLAERQLEGDNLMSGQLGWVTVPDYLPSDLGAVIVTLGRDEIDRADLSGMIDALRSRLRGDVPVGIVYLEPGTIAG
ncbi:GumC family protein [Pelagovum pacificum]|uniref:Polysaccharide chain length determinant N-terminal domain-containing protein n=1 Tax=Pelagovum pacificum TaxID=2588711 RepID=A0A5C5GGH9_9RHOB|nr:hypothetical protein [Pelagovum pacificum]QQA43549.1 hypothetical protein I8N54_02935 [Pelagovum pacificum]TNY33314.1 hypothetical protein FHY64_08595 [Pelagovum pacificum]